MRLLRSLVGAIAVGMLAGGPARADRPDEEELFQASLTVLDLFMQAGQRAEFETAARWLKDYPALKSRARYDSRRMINRHRERFAAYEAIDGEIYGYEVRRGWFGTEVHVEGVMVCGEAGLEYAAVLIYQNRRWTISKLDLG